MTKDFIDWYWEHGGKRADNYALSKGDWLDKVYAIGERRRKFEASTAGARSTLAVWGPSQAGKSTLFSRHLDLGKTPERGSPCLTWDASAPTVFQQAVGDQISLNPYNHGGDGTGCATRYALVGQVKHPRHPVALRLNTPGEVMHAFACGYLSECKVSEQDGNEVRWDAKSFEEAFLKAGLGKSDVVSPEAFDLLREVLRIVELFITTRNSRYKDLANGWEKLRRKTLNECAALRDVEEVVRMAKRLFWDNAQPISWTFDRIRAMVARLNWPADRIYCSAEVAKLIIDIDTFEKVTKEMKNRSPARSVRLASGSRAETSWSSVRTLLLTSPANSLVCSKLWCARSSFRCGRRRVGPRPGLRSSVCWPPPTCWIFRASPIVIPILPSRR